jgi:methylenetetrahydrofolate dehydrogenase (NADP+)/methenyltetrahydrofolate cyclohydrolase
MAQILDGKALAKDIRAQLKSEIELIVPKLGRAPGLAVILVGDDPASATYVGNKEKAAAEIGMVGRVIRMAATATQAEVEEAVDRLNADPAIDGFIVQLPLPAHLDEASILGRIHPDKDADGLHPMNLGRVVAGLPGPKPCTPVGCIKLLELAGTKFQGARAVVIGRSEIVGKPMAFLLLERHATVTICHSRTERLDEEVGRADIVVAAVGKPAIIKGAWIKPGAVVIDVGTNRVDGKLVGDVEFGEAEKRARAITPVPGGVGPMTIAGLMTNAVAAARRKIQRG